MDDYFGYNFFFTADFFHGFDTGEKKNTPVPKYEEHEQFALRNPVLGRGRWNSWSGWQQPVYPTNGNDANS